MTKRKTPKDRQYNDQKKKTKGQTMQWPKETHQRPDNTMTKRKTPKDRKYNDQRKRTNGQTIQWPKEKD